MVLSNLSLDLAITGQVRLEPLQLSGIYKTTSGLGFNCLFVLKPIHPETYSFSYSFLMKERAHLVTELGRDELL